MRTLKIFLIFTFLFAFNLSFALDAPANITLDQAYEHKLDISWSHVSGADLYTVSYGTKSAPDGDYEYDSEIVVDSISKVTIEKLNPGTKYYVAVKSYDSLQEESEYSDEFSFSTLRVASNSLKIKDIKVVDSSNLEIYFNHNLHTDEINTSVNISNLDNSLEDIGISKYSFDDNILKISLSNDLSSSQSYSATIINLEGKNGEKIQSGVDGVRDFETPESFSKDESIIISNSSSTSEDSSQEFKLNSAEDRVGQDESNISDDTNFIKSNVSEDSNSNLENSDSNTLDDSSQEVEFNSAEDRVGQDENNISETSNSIKSNIEEDSNKKITQAVAKQSEDLPTTGPTETFLFILLSFIITSLVLLSRNKANL